MDFLLRKEIQELKGDIESKNIALEADKFTFEQKLKNGLKDEIIKELNNPSKPNFWLGFKIKFNRWINNKRRK